MLRLSRGWTHSRHLTSPCSSQLRRRRPLTTLAIETSCDDTAVAVLEKRGNEAQLHFNGKISADNSAHGGIHPLVALESHQEKLATLVQKAIAFIPAKDRGRRTPDFVSVTRGPGMRSNLAIGIDTAKGLALAWNIPIIGVHHMQAHALTPRLVSALSNTNSPSKPLTPSFPFLTLLISGGHTLLLQTTALTTHHILANTIDNALGDCLDKAARAILPPELLASSPTPSYGPLLERFGFPNGAQDYAYTPPATRDAERRASSIPSPFGWRMPALLLSPRGGHRAAELEFSFAGMTTYVAYLAERGWDRERDKIALRPRASPMLEDEARWLARETMRVCFEHLANRVAMFLHTEAQTAPPESQTKTLVLSGGVAANRFLLHVMRSYLDVRGFSDVEVCAPPVALCTDNAAMIAWTACEMVEAGLAVDDGLGFRAFRKWSLENLLAPEREAESRPVSERMLEKYARQAEKRARRADGVEVGEVGEVAAAAA